jgi:hypothetical protein
LPRRNHVHTTPRRPDPELLGPAIAMLTAWAISEDNPRPQSVGEIAASYIAEGMTEVDMVTGLLNLAGMLLIRLEKATGTPAPELMRDLAAKYMT